MKKAAIIITSALVSVCALAENVVTGTWAVAAQPERSDSGIWRYRTDATGLPGHLSYEAPAHAEAYEVTGTATVYYASEGHRFYQAEYANGKRHGQWQMWYPNGTTLSSGRFDHGDFTGVWTWRKPVGSISQTVDWSKVHALAPSPPADGYGGWDDETMTRYADRIARFGPYPSHLIAPYVVTNASVVGEWGDPDRYFPVLEFTRINVSPAENGVHTVTIRSFGCLARYVFTNRATFVDGVLRFDRPVCTYPADPFRNAYLVGDP